MTVFENVKTKKKKIAWKYHVQENYTLFKPAG